MSEYKDPRKSVYTITVVHQGQGFIGHIETHSNKKKALARYERLSKLWNKEQSGTYMVEMHTTKLQRKSRWE